MAHKRPSVRFKPPNVTDLTLLPELTVDNVLDLLQERYKEDKIYTRCGDVLLSVNPFKQIPIYDQQHHDQYLATALNKDMEPHIFQVAAQAFRRLQESQKHQVVLVSGESGAGKTENTKCMVQHVMQMCRDTQGDLHERILQINPLLEAFGNAKTVLNDNSSRFAKYLQLDFTKDGNIKGATVKDYMLEKSRVVHQGRGEGNFHIFYSFLAGLSKEDRDNLSIGEKNTFRIADVSGRPLRWEDGEMFRKYLEIFQRIRLSEEEIENVKTILAAILHLGNLEFMEDDRKEGVQVWDEVPLDLVVDMLEVNTDTLATMLVTKKISIGMEDIATLRSKKSADGARDALVKSLYDRLFGWVVRKVNDSLHPADEKSTNAGSIGVLDICGFESLQVNSFEQMCINLVNEKIQGYMNDHIFKQERKMYEAEGVDIQIGDLDYNNNDDILDMFLGRGMILSLINEDTKLEQATDETLVDKLGQTIRSRDGFRILPGDRVAFRIVHFAGEVSYDARGFLEKNRDALSPEMVECLKASSNVMVADLFIVNKGNTGTISVTNYDYRASRRRPPVKRPTKRDVNLTSSIVTGLRDTLRQKYGAVRDGREHQQKQTQTVIDYFKNSLSDLVQRMKDADHLFVRCIKPNKRLAADNFDEKFVVDQLKYNGIAEVARIRKKGWPIHRTYGEILKRFQILSSKNLQDESMSSREGATEDIFKAAHLQTSNYTFGRDKVFMKEVALEKLEKALREKTEKRRREEELKRKREEERQRKQREEEKRIAAAVEMKNRKPPVPPSTLTTIQEPSTSGTYSSSGESVTSSMTSSQSAAYMNVKTSTPTRTPTRGSPPPATSGSSSKGDGAPALPPRTNDGRKSEHNFWDIFRIVDTELPRKEAFDQMTFKVVKVITYILLFLFLLVSCVGQRIGLMLLISNIPAGTNETILIKRGSSFTEGDPPKFAQYFYLAVVIIIPYVLTTIWSFLKWLFGAFPTPGVLTWFMVLLIEILHSFGLSVLVFWVLPQYDLMYGSLLLSATCILPSILMVTCSSWTITGDSKGKAGVKKIFDILAFICQVSVIPLLLYFPTQSHIPKEPGLNSVNTDNRMDILNIAAVATAFVFSSLKCWEAFVDGTCEQLDTKGESTSKNYNNTFMNTLLKIRYELQEGRYVVGMISGTLKIMVTCGVLYGVMHLRAERETLTESWENVETMFKGLTHLYRRPMKFAPLLLVTLSSFVAYYTAHIACKLQMQIVSFSIPLLLCVPVTQGILALNCYLDQPYKLFLEYFSFFNNTCGCDSDVCYAYFLGIPWFISLLWLTRHIWSPKQGRLEEFDRLFVNPFYCGVLLQENILLNRRRHKEQIRRKIEIDEENGEATMQYFIVDPRSKLDLMDNIQQPVPDASPDIPFIYACATMWHETKIEMTQLMKSMFRLDYDRHLREECALILGRDDVKDRFNFEGHIFFDDALELSDKDKYQANPFVKTLISVMSDACSSVHQKYMQIPDPCKVVTPYGAKLIWEMPGGSLLYVHVKDKNKIRHRKRWSQVMYMYYLLGYQLLKDSGKDVLREYNNRDDRNRDAVKELFNIEVQKKTQNTFILALDGDTDFSPGSVRVLLDRMINERVAAVCGRIHPIGSGPMVWYQMFEYAVGHWLQKATEHVLGCVLCSPGCFSLFRASALMDNNIMKRYTTFPTQPGHFLQYDQGEDRWLCTLLLQQGYRVDYAAAADAYTYAPEGFNEFFNQRRRWTPSTLANILDLLSSADVTVARNSNISKLYIVYQIAMMFGTILGPGTVIMMIAGAIDVVFGLGVIWSYVISLLIPTIYLVICFTTTTKVQLYVAAVFSAVYSFVMMAVIAGTIITAVETSPIHPSVIFTVLLFFMFAFAGVLHWKEINCLPHVFLYFLCIPSGYLLLFIYSLANMNNVSWGTREVATRKSKKQLAAEEKEKAEANKKEQEKKKDGFFARMFFSSTYVKEFKNLFDSIKPKLMNGNDKVNEEMIALLKEMNQNIAKLSEKSVDSQASRDTVEALQTPDIEQCLTSDCKMKPEEEGGDDDDDDDIEELDPYRGKHWVHDPDLGTGPVMELCADENGFWEMFIKKYLKPIEKDEQREKEIKAGLIELKNGVCFAMVMINCLWMAVNFMFQLRNVASVDLPIMEDGKPKTLKIGILGLLFIIFFTSLILIQFFGMIIHRWETLLHLISMTELRSSLSIEQQRFKMDQVNIVQRLMGIIEPAPDYDDDEEINERIKQVVQQGHTARDLALSRTQNLLGASRRVGSQIPNLKNTILGNGFATFKWRKGKKSVYTTNLDREASFIPGAIVDRGLRQRNYNHAVDNFFADAQERGLIQDVPEAMRQDDDPDYVQIKDVMPGRMGRDFARKLKHLKQIDRERSQNAEIRRRGQFNGILRNTNMRPDFVVPIREQTSL